MVSLMRLTMQSRVFMVSSIDVEVANKIMS
jgi:hypothetical protein